MRKAFTRFFLFLFAAITLLNIWIVITGNYYIYKAVYHNFADVDDYKIFPNRLIKKSSAPQPWPISGKYNKAPLSQELQSTLDKFSSIGFLVIQHDSIIHEQYWEDYGPDSYSNSFSMAKSFVSALIGIAIKEGKINSAEQYVSEYIPEFKEGEKSKIKIKDVLTMSSGLAWNESYANPFSVTTEAYYGSDLYRLMIERKVESEPGKEFSYKSGDTQILGFILMKATGKSVAQYAQEKLWEPMGMVNNAMWSLDKENGNEKAYCCINSNARDFARLGYLYLHQGNWKGKQLIDTSYIQASLIPASLKFENGKNDFYGYQWWTVPDYKGEKIFYARGILGQMIIVMPERDIVIVRLGKNRGEKAKQHFKMVFQVVDGVKGMLNSQF
ncbi:MAG: beta-lactamase family protein [Cytophagaceae bacterium]|nr:beta-lactamase family protein [Cytophagaceae bacterium]